MIHPYIKRMWLTALSAVLLSSALSCIYPVYDGVMDISEQQSVWQYLSVYSIYQDRLPDECGDNTPKDLFDIIDDRLRGTRYTGYADDRPRSGSAALAGSQANSGNMLKITDSTAYLRIPDFLENALGDFNACRSNLESFQNIVIDLRDNGGGYLYATDSILGEFLPTGTEYISTRHRIYDGKILKGITVDWENSKNQKENPRLTNKKISVLINGGSASASEIMASALKDRANAHLLGIAATYGKGIGQVVIPRSGRKTMSITFMQIRGVSDRTGNYHEKGIEPDTIPEFLKKEAEDSCYLAELNLVDQSLYCAVKLMEPSAPGEKIFDAAQKIWYGGMMRKKQEAEPGPIGVYVVTEPDPLE